MGEMSPHTPVSAWISYLLLLAGMITFAILEPSSTLRIGNSEYTFWFLPLVSFLFALSGFLTLRKSVHFFILNLLAFTIIYLIVGVMGYGWFVKEIATLFFVMGIFSGIATNKSANEITRLHAIVEGRVQGVSFRYFVERNAISLNLTGWVRNRWEGTVELAAEGKREDLDKLVVALQRGPRSAFVSKVKTTWHPATGEFHGFSIRRTV